MFKLQPNPTFTANVDISTPTSTAPLKLEFKHLGKEGLKKLNESATTRPDIETLSEIIVSWFDVFDNEGNQIAYSADALAQLIDAYPAAPFEIYRAYINAAAGSRVKN